MQFMRIIFAHNYKHKVKVIITIKKINDRSQNYTKILVIQQRKF